MTSQWRIPNTTNMIEAIFAFGVMCAVTVAVQAARVARAREVPVSVEEENPEAAKILLLFAEAEQMNKAA